MEISPKSHIENFKFFFQWFAYIKYEWFLQELEMACDFAIKISIYIVCERTKATYYRNKHYFKRTSAFMSQTDKGALSGGTTPTCRKKHNSFFAVMKIEDSQYRDLLLWNFQK